MNRSVYILLLLALLVSACGAPAPSPTAAATAVAQPTAAPTTAPTAAPQATPTQAAAEDVLYLNLTWHQHQPLYYKNEDGVYTRPWVRAHATKDYYDMASILEQYRNVHATFNITPVLIRQIDDFVQNGAKDLYWVMAEIPAAELTESDQRFLLERFFDANWDNIIARFPRYQELLDQRGSDAAAIDQALQSFTEQDYRDLQVWFNLAWFDPDFLAQEPLKALVDKGRDFTEADKQVVFGEVQRVMAEVLPLHRRMQEAGQIAVTTTPFAHPILPLIVDTNQALEGAPTAEMPTQRFSYPVDAAEHLARSVEIYQEHFGVDPVGLWPGEGSVGQIIVPFVARAGYRFMQTGEPVLAKSLGIETFTRDGSETVQEADQLYRPYYVQDKSGNQVAVFFRDGVLSDKLGFTYSGTPGEEAADDLMNRLENIRARLKAQGAEGPHIVSIILDGENAWEYYPNDAKDFLHALYQRLNDSQTIKTVTPAEYLDQFPEQSSLENLFAAAWFSPNFDTWIGEPEENEAWDYLAQTRALLQKYLTGVREAPGAEALAEAQDFMYLAEGSDWFWWYGADQDSGQDSYFDTGYRALLRGVYESLGEPAPTFIDVPIIQPNPVSPAAPQQGLVSPRVDGRAGEGEWDAAAAYPAEGSSPAAILWMAVDAKNLTLRLQVGESLTAVERIGVYLSAPRQSEYYPFANGTEGQANQLLGLKASHLFEYAGGRTLNAFTATPDGWQPGEGAVGQAAAAGDTIELAIPLEALGELQAGDQMLAAVVLQPANQVLPLGGPALITLPDLGNATVLLEVEDPEGDDHGPGGYTYPSDAVFQNKAFDLSGLTVAVDEQNVIFRVRFYGPIPNAWDSPNGLSIQTLDIYVDQDPGQGTGARLLFPGRNAALAEGFGWETGLWVEGWTPQVVAPEAGTGALKQVTEASFTVLVDPGTRVVTIRVPKSVFGEGDPAAWGYLVAVMGQEGYPATGVWRVRDVEAQAAQWKFGGAPADTNHTRILDVVWPAGAEPTQEEALSTYPASTGDPATLAPEDFAQLPMLTTE